MRFLRNENKCIYAYDLLKLYKYPVYCVVENHLAHKAVIDLFIKRKQLKRTTSFN